MRGVLVDDDQAVLGLRHDVVGVELRARGAERARERRRIRGGNAGARVRGRTVEDGEARLRLLGKAAGIAGAAQPCQPPPCRCRSAAARSRRAPQAGKRQASRRRPLAAARKPCSAKRVADRADDQPAHHAGIAEAHLELRRMDVDVELGGVELEEERRDRKAVARQHVSIGGAERAGEQRIAERAAVDEQELLQRVGAMEGRQAGMAGEPRALPLRLDRHGVLGGTPRPAPAPRARRDRLCPRAEDRAVRRSSPASVKRTFGCASASRRTTSVMAFASARSERRNFSRAGVAKKRSRTSTCVPIARPAGTGARSRPPSTSIAQPCSSLACRDSIESRATAPTEASASPRKPSVAIAERSSPSSFDVQCRATASDKLVALHASPVVPDADKALSPAGGDDVDPLRTGIERILDELLHDARRALHHLAGSDAVDDVIGETADRQRGPRVGSESLASMSG